MHKGIHDTSYDDPQEFEISGVIDVENMVNHREAQEVAPLVVRESEEVRLRGALDMAELIMDDRRLEESRLLAKDLGRLRWAISQSQVDVIKHDPISVEEVILVHLCTGEVKETETVIKSDGKLRLTVLV
ncbi:hypothetical protein Aduo_016452 [Ancylostoma duodenale]